MKRTLLLIVILILGAPLCLSQTITRVRISNNNYFSIRHHIIEPDYHPEAGVIVVDALVARKGDVESVSLDEEQTTVKDKRQIEGSIRSANRSYFVMLGAAPDSLRCKITFNFEELSQIQVDSLQLYQMEMTNELVQKIEQATDSQRYKLYPTDNLWTFLELDTVFGVIYQVQYSIKGDDYRFRSGISYDDLRVGSFYSSDSLIPGRFELYKTQNMYNYILLDKFDGRIWQVQWSLEPENRFIKRIN